MGLFTIYQEYILLSSIKWLKGGFFMITKDLLAGLYYYNFTIIKTEKDYRLVDLENGECFERMSIYYIRQLLTSWNQHRSNSFV